MKNKIVSIEEKVPKIATLPDGYYEGVMGGYIIEVRYRGKLFELKSEDGIRGSGSCVVVKVENGIATYEFLQPKN